VDIESYSFPSTMQVELFKSSVQFRSLIFSVNDFESVNIVMDTGKNFGLDIYNL
jgi:hypothetical protein